MRRDHDTIRQFASYTGPDGVFGRDRLLNKELLAEQLAICGAPIWRETKDGQRLTLVITDAGRAAIGLRSDQDEDAIVDTKSSNKPSRTDRTKPRRTTKRNTAGVKRTATHQGKVGSSHSSLRLGTKQALLVDLLKRKQGATIAEASKATGWQPHSVRGAISGTLKKKLGLVVVSDTAERRGRVYRIKAGR